MWRGLETGERRGFIDMATKKKIQKPRSIPLYKKANWENIKKGMASTLEKMSYFDEHNAGVIEMWEYLFVIWNGEFAQGDYQYNNKMVLKIYLILENTSRLEWMDLV
jgi:hypothetical protein